MNMKYEELLFLCNTFFVGSMVAGVGSYIWVGHLALYLVQVMLMLVSVHFHFIVGSDKSIVVGWSSVCSC